MAGDKFRQKICVLTSKIVPPVRKITSWQRIIPFWYPGDNFGDQPINEFLLPCLFPGLKPQNAMNYTGNDKSYVLSGIGSILGLRKACKVPELPVFVFGSGFQYGHPHQLPKGSVVFCVRGKYTCKAMKIDPALAVADPAILLTDFVKRDVKSIKGRHGTIMKHDYFQKHIYDCDEPIFSSRVSGKLLGNDIVRWLRYLWACEKVSCDALHAAIVADAYGIPWKPLRWEQKWADHFGMLGINDRPTDFVISDRDLLDNALKQLRRQSKKLRELVV